MRLERGIEADAGPEPPPACTILTQVSSPPALLGMQLEIGIWHLVLGDSDGNAGLLNWNAVVPRLQSKVSLCFYFYVPFCLCLNSVEALNLPKAITLRFILSPLSVED